MGVPQFTPVPPGQKHFPGSAASLVYFVPSPSTASIISLSAITSNLLLCPFILLPHLDPQMTLFAPSEKCRSTDENAGNFLHPSHHLTCPCTCAHLPLRLTFPPEPKLSPPWASSGPSLRQLSSLFYISTSTFSLNPFHLNIKSLAS